MPHSLISLPHPSAHRFGLQTSPTPLRVTEALDLSTPMMAWASDVAGHDADVHAAIYPPNQRILEDIGESRRDGGRILRVMERRARASDAPRDASDGSEVGGSPHRASRKSSASWTGLKWRREREKWRQNSGRNRGWASCVGSAARRAPSSHHMMLRSLVNIRREAGV